MNTLGDIADVLNGFAFKSSTFTTSGVPVIKIKNMASGKIDFSETDFYPEITSQLEKYKIENGDILVSMTGSHLTQRNSAVGKVTRYSLKTPSLLNQRVGKIVPKGGNCDINFLFYLIANDQTQEYWASKAGGAANQANISPNIIKSLPITLINLDMQKQIGKLLSNYDQLIDNNLTRIRILEEMTQRLYSEWFIKFKFPGHEKIKMVDSFLGKIPEGWEVVSMSELADFVNGYPFKPADLGNSGLPIIKIPELRSGILDKTTRNNGESIPKKYLIKDGDILFSWSATLLVNIWNSGDALLNQHLFKVEPKNKTQKSYVFFVLKKLVENLSKHVVGATMQHLRRGTIVDSKILLPISTILENYEELTSTYMQEVGNLQMQNQVLQKTRDLLIPQLVTSKRELKN